MFGDLEKLQGIVNDNVLAIVFFFGIFWFMITKLAESKDAVAKLLGPWGKRIQANREKRDELHREEVRKEAKRFLKEAGQLEPPDYQAVKERLVRLAEEMGDLTRSNGELQLQNRGLRAYVLQDEDWHFDDERIAVRQQREVKERISFDDFMGEFMAKNARR